MKIFFCFLIILFSFSFQFAEENSSGKLADFEEEINKPVDDEDDNDDNDFECEDEDDGNFLVDLAMMLTYELFIGVPGEQQARKEFLWSYGFNKRPYGSNNFGIYDVYAEKTSQVNLSTHYFYHDKNLTGQILNGNIFMTPYLSLEGSFIRLKENLESDSDRLDIYDFYLNYIRLRSSYINWWWGLGIKHIKRDNTYTGFSLNTGMEVFPIDPISFDISFNSGFIKEKVVTEISCSIRFHLDRFYLQTGYLREAVGSEAIPGISAGIGLYF